MTPAKQRSLLQGQSGLAAKVFEFVPIQEAWTVVEIQAELRKHEKSGADIRAVRACLGALEECGLIRELHKGIFQRADASAPSIIPADKEIPIVPKPTLTTVKPDKNKAPQSALELLSPLADEIVRVQAEFAERFKVLATRIEEAALAIEQEREADAKGLEKFHQLQSLLKGMQ